MMRCVVAGLMCLTLAAPAVAKDKHKHDHGKHRQLSAHEHGSGSFNVAIEGNKVAMELEAPGADIVGFEHKARTKKQKAAVSKAKSKLKELSNVVVLSEAAGCKLEKASIELHIESGDHDGHDHGKKKKAKHSHGHNHGHKHGKKAAKKEESHSEFHAEYQLTCASPEKLVEIAFPYFKNFKGAQELEVSVAGPKSQKKFEVERKTGKINLGGII